MTDEQQKRLDVLFKMFKIHFTDDPEEGIYGKINQTKTDIINLINRVKIVEDRLNSRHLMKLMIAGGFVSVCVATIVAIIKNFILK